MASSPPNAHAIATIRTRLAEVSGELVAIEKRWRSLLEAHHALSQTLRMFDPDADSHPVKPKRPYRRVLPFGGGKLSLLVLDALRASRRPMTTLDVIAALGDHANAIPGVERRVRTTLNYLARARGTVIKEGRLEATRWSLPKVGSL
jgi:hypothetical protein